jgi:elongator complex protein 3
MRHRAQGQVTGLSQEEARVRAVAETVAALIQNVKSGKDVDLNSLKCEISSKYGISR